MSSHPGPRIPMAPFTAWCNDQVEQAAKRAGAPRGWDVARSNMYGAATDVAERLGVHIRILNRLRRGMYAGSKDHRKGEFPADTISRYYVEDLLTRAGTSFYDVYPEFAHERDIELEPDEFCLQCGEYTTPIQGCCPWCDTRVDDLRMAA
jgi:hypothetical protein